MRREIRLKGLLTIRKGGRVYHYFRARGKKLVALPNLPTDHPDFLMAYAQARGAAEQKQARLKPGSIDAMCEAAMLAKDFQTKSDAYRSMLRRHFEAIRAQGGDAMAADLEAYHIGDDVAALDGGVAVARFKAWRFLCRFGVKARMMPVDVSRAVEPPRLDKSDGHAPWTGDDLAAFRARWPVGTTPRAAVELLQWTGARISDAVLLSPAMIDRDGVLTFVQVKTKRPSFVPWTCPVPRFAEAADRDLMHEALMPGDTFLATSAGTRSEKGLGNLIRWAAREAGVEKSAHGLRKTRALRLADGGATTHQIAAWTGHVTLKEVAHYTAQADRKRAVMG